MKPNFIYLIRHAESAGNVDREIYKTVPDWKLPLTDIGHEQAKQMAEKLHQDIICEQQEFLSICTFQINDRIKLYCSPWHRTRQTAKPLLDLFKEQIDYSEDPRLREQDWGNFAKDHLTKEIDDERDNFGRFFYRMPNGESGADVFDRISNFFGTLHRDFEKRDFPRHCIIVTHGNAIRIFLMRWFHWTVEEYEDIRNPSNCTVITMKKTENDKYKLITELAKGRTTENT